MEKVARQRLREQLARLADGDREAFHPVFLALHPILRRFARRHLPAEDAEDAAQEALVKVFAQASRFDRDRDAIAWALGIAAWEIRTMRRRRQRRREEGLESILQARPDAAPSPEDAAIATSLDALLDGALGSLSPHDEATLRAYARARLEPLGLTIAATLAWLAGTLGCIVAGSAGIGVLVAGLAFGLAPTLTLRRAWK